jgi:hypothetical protein
VDLFWVHAWDQFTPVEEVIRALDDLIRSGKVLYTGISDTPAWVVSQANTFAELRDVAAEMGCKASQLALAWLRSRPNVIPIIGARTRVSNWRITSAALTSNSHLPRWTASTRPRRSTLASLTNFSAAHLCKITCTAGCSTAYAVTKSSGVRLLIAGGLHYESELNAFYRLIHRRQTTPL